MTSDNILSVKVNKKDKSISVNVNYYYPELKRNREEEITDIPHQDFNAALSELSEFIANIYHADSSSESYHATGFKYVKDNFVLLMGKMSSETGSVIGITTPAINLDEDSYGFEDDLRSKINTLSYETLLLLNGSKLGVTQLTIEDSIKQNEGTFTLEVKENTKLITNEQELNDELEKIEEDEEIEPDTSYLDATTIKDIPDNDEFLFNDKV
jgi:hypothetical protein